LQQIKITKINGNNAACAKNHHQTTKPAMQRWSFAHNAKSKPEFEMNESTLIATL